MARHCYTHTIQNFATTHRNTGVTAEALNAIVRCFSSSRGTVRKVACSRVLRRSVINLTGPVELLQLEPHSAPGRRRCASANWPHIRVASAEATRTPLIRRVPSPRVPRDVVHGWSCHAKCWRGEREKKTEYHSVPRPGFGVPTLKKNGTLRLPTGHKGHNIFSTLSLCIFYSASCLFASSSLQPHPSAVYCHIMPQYKMLVCRFTNRLWGWRSVWQDDINEKCFCSAHSRLIFLGVKNSFFLMGKYKI